MVENRKPIPGQAISVLCPICGALSAVRNLRCETYRAKPGEKCELNTGLLPTNPHVSRDRAAFSK